MCEKFKLFGNKIKRNTFGEKGRYLILVIIIKSNSSNEYIINISIKHKLLGNIKEYFEEYIFWKLCGVKIWKELVLNREKSFHN